MCSIRRALCGKDLSLYYRTISSPLEPFRVQSSIGSITLSAPLDISLISTKRSSRMSQFMPTEYSPLLLKGFSAWISYNGTSHVVRGIKEYLPQTERAKLPPSTISLMDSQIRFLGGTYIAYGAALCWTSYDIRARHLALSILLAGLAVGGIGRALSAAVFGWGFPWLRRAMITEILVPLLVCWFGLY